MAVEGIDIDKEETFLIFKSVPKRQIVPAKQKKEKIYLKKIPQGKKYLPTNLDMLNLTYN